MQQLYSLTTAARRALRTRTLRPAPKRRALARAAVFCALALVLIAQPGCGDRTSDRASDHASESMVDRGADPADTLPIQPITPTASDPEAALGYADAHAAELGLSRHTFVEGLMGTQVAITLYADDEADARRAADAAFAEMRRLESVMSDYPQSYPDSELLGLAAAAVAEPGEPQPVSDDLWPVLWRAKQVYEATDGAFDITARPFTGLWRVSRERGVLPPAEALAEHAPLVGMHHLVLDDENQTAYLDAAGAWMDLGGIAKGYIADRAVDVLRDHGLTIVQVQAGGDMSFGDAPPGLEGWPVSVPDFPRDGGEEGAGLSFFHANGGASVSGDAFRFVEIDGVRYSHVVDPRTGLGVTGSRYCCVRGPSAFATDAAATAGCVMEDAAFDRALEKLARIEGPLQGWRFQGAAQADAGAGDEAP
ncbi:MAG: FAD:protein FMN transferase [Phycisphaerales bacterium JB063]